MSAWMMWMSVLLGASAVAAAAEAPQDDQRAWAPFVIPADVSDESLIRFEGEPIAVDSPRVVAKDGHFFVGDERLRIWGVNLSYGGNFPDHEDAARVAERLEAFGVNSVRFHHMDVEYFRFPQSIWDPQDPTAISTEALDRLDYFVDQLARRGIYANLNLHVSRTHSQHLGLPDSSATGNYDKIVDLFTPQLIEAQHDYARQLLTHVNKYRGVTYAADPAVAFVEINNEDSFFMWGGEEKLRKMHPFYTEILEDLYNRWLTERYGATAALAAAWSPPQVEGGQAAPIDLPLVGDRAAWHIGGYHGAVAGVVSSPVGGDAARIEVQKVGAAAWHLEFQRSGIELSRERQYELTLRARADAPRHVVVAVRQGHAPWQTLGLRQSIQLTTDWQTFTLPFHPPENEANGRVSFLLGQSPVAFEVADIQLRPRPLVGLDPQERLEDAGVQLFISGASPARIRDRMRFLATTEKAYYDGFRRFIRDDVGTGALVTGTMAFGFLGLWAQSGMDYIDAHTYWAHPNFPAGWSASNWTIDQKAFVDHYEESKLFDDAATRLEGKPFTVSEYSHPAPNDYQAEGVPLIASMAAAQDWDGVWFFGYADHHDHWDAAAFDGFFNFHANPAKWGFMPAGAAIFREAGIEPLSHGQAWPLTRVDVGGDPLSELIALHIKHERSMINGLFDRWGVGRQTVLRQRVAVRFTGTPHDLPSHPDSRTRLDLEPGRLLVSGRGGQVRIETANATAGLAADGGFAVFTAAALDGEPLEGSDRVLFTLLGRCENTDMAFSGDRRTVRTKWGVAPVRIEAIGATLCWPSAASAPLIALGPDGAPGASIPVKTTDSCPVALTFSPTHQTMWYLLAPPPTSNGD